MPISSGITRWSICPSVSSVLQLRPVAPCSSARPPFGQLEPLAELEGVVVGDDDLRACLMSSSMSLRDQLAAVRSSCPGRSAAGRAGDP